MFKFLRRKIRFLFQQNQRTFSKRESGKEELDFPLVSELIEENQSFVQEKFGTNLGVNYRIIQIGKENSRKGLLISIAGMAEKEILYDNIIKPLLEMELSGEEDIIDYIREKVISVLELTIEDNLNNLVAELANGQSVLFISREKRAIVLNAEGYSVRAIEEPQSETVVRGPREGFVENLQTNLIMLRRKIRNPDLRMEARVLGTRTNTRVIVAYIKGIANQEIVEEVNRRLDSLKIDSLIDAGFIEEYIEDAPLSLFPTIGNTEKPDVAAMRLLNGKVAIFTEGTPSVLTVPHLFIDAFHKADDYYTRSVYVSFMRIVRLIAFLSATLAPGIAISLLNFHTELVPTPLLISIAEASEGVPFPLVYEVLFVLLMYEWLREAGYRMPGQVGQAVNIIGAVILGETAVTAGLVGAPTVILIASAAIATYLVPFLFDTVTLLRIMFILVSAAFGLFGVILLGMVITAHLASLRSFGIPYTAPLFPINYRDLGDSIIRLPLWKLNFRPRTLRPANLRRSWGRVWDRENNEKE